MDLFIPLNQMIVFVALVSVSFLFSRYRLGLAIVFGFSFYWAFVHNRDRVLAGPGAWGDWYLLCGSILILFALISLLSEAGLTRRGMRILRNGR